MILGNIVKDNNKYKLSTYWFFEKKEHNYFNQNDKEKIYFAYYKKNMIKHGHINIIGSFTEDGEIIYEGTPAKVVCIHVGIKAPVFICDLDKNFASFKVALAKLLEVQNSEIFFNNNELKNFYHYNL